MPNMIKNPQVVRRAATQTDVQDRDKQELIADRQQRIASLDRIIERSRPGSNATFAAEVRRDRLAEELARLQNPIHKTDIGDSSKGPPTDVTRGSRDSPSTSRNQTQSSNPGNISRSSGGGTAQSPLGPSGRPVNTNTTSIQPVAVKDFQEDIPDNVLNDYMDVQYHMILSMVPSTELPNIQGNIPKNTTGASTNERFDQVRQQLIAENAVVIASTGDIFHTESVNLSTGELIRQGQIQDDGVRRDTDASTFRNLTGRNYYNIKSLTLDNVVSPSKNNPFIADMLTGRMVLIEPHGFKLHEDLRTVADQIGYKDINVGRIIYRLDIYFSGYNQDTGHWDDFIPMTTRRGGSTISKVSYYVAIAAIEASVDFNGTSYNLDLVPSGHVAWRPEEMTLEAGTVLTGLGGNSGSSVQSFGGFLDVLSVHMNSANNQRNHGQIKREYEFLAPKFLLDAGFFQGNFESIKNLLRPDPKGGSGAVIGRDVDVLTLIEAALKDMPEVWKVFIKDDDLEHATPRIHWTVRFNAIYLDGPNTGLHDYQKIKLQYIIEPFATFKKGTVEKRSDAALMTETEAQVSRVEAMLKLGMVHRIYNYIHTEENTEVINFDINLKAFYYRAITNQTVSASAAGLSQAEASSNQINHIEEQNRQNDNARDTGEEPAVPKVVESSVDNSLRRIFGGQSNPRVACSIGNQPTPFDLLGGGLHEMPKTDDFTSIVGNDQYQRSRFLLQLDDHLKNDLLILDGFEVKGDPLWLLSPYASQSGAVLEPQNGGGGEQIAIVQTRASKVIFLKMFAPAQDDLMNPDRQGASTSCNIIGGFYEVYKIKNRFEGGKFTQMLEGAKIDNLNYVENFVGLRNRRGSGSRTVSTDSNVPQRSSQPNIATFAGFNG